MPLPLTHVNAHPGNAAKLIKDLALAHEMRDPWRM
jgi:hypothetical protein